MWEGGGGLSSASVPANNEGDQRARLRILIADDHDTFRHEVERFLEREGFAVVGAASNGLEALRLARELQPDVAVLDLSMPVLDGFETAKAMAGVCPLAKLVALTIHSDSPYVAQRGMAANCRR